MLYLKPMNHDHNHHITLSNRKEYLKFAGVIALILVGSLLVYSLLNRSFLDAFMGVFFIIFSLFKLSHLREFAYGFQSYDLIAKKSLIYSYFYPFVQLTVGLLYIAGLGAIPLDIFVIVVSLISGAGVINSLLSKRALHCVYLGNVIKLPLSTISFVEDFGMAIMAFVMIFMR
jgi:hypothetical protein